MTKEFSTPDVFGQAYDGKDMAEKGTIVQIVSLDTLPPHFLERMPELADKPDGYVLKRYRPRAERSLAGEVFTPWEEVADEADIAFFEEEVASGRTFPLSTHDSEKLTQIDVITVLKRRQAELRGYLEDVLPEAVLKSEFFLAPDNDGQFTMYELQEKIPSYLDLGKLKQENLSRLSAEQKTKLRIQLEALLSKIEALFKKDNLPSFYQRFVPDLNVRNIAVTDQGIVKLYDTNMCHRRGDALSLYVLSFTRGVISKLVQTLS